MRGSPIGDTPHRKALDLTPVQAPTTKSPQPEPSAITPPPPQHGEPSPATDRCRCCITRARTPRTIDNDWIHARAVLTFCKRPRGIFLRQVFRCARRLGRPLVGVGTRWIYGLAGWCMPVSPGCRAGWATVGTTLEGLSHPKAVSWSWILDHAHAAFITPDGVRVASRSAQLKAGWDGGCDGMG